MGIEKITIEEMKEKTMQELPKDILDECRIVVSTITNPSTNYNSRKLAQLELAMTINTLSNEGYYTEYLSSLYDKYVKQYGDW